jgi:hypothetical protein
VRGKGLRTDRIENPATVERQERGQEVSMTFKVVLRHALFIVCRVDDLPQIKLIERILAVDVEVAILD